jgi:hypothetical protein
MAEQVQQSDADSKYRVALDLARLIMSNDGEASRKEDGIIDLYLKCRRAVLSGTKG